MADYAIVQDVQDRYGSPITGEVRTRQVQAWLDDVHTTIRAQIPGFDAAVAAGTPDAAVVKMVVANAVVRRLRNPDGLRTTTTSIDDGSITKTRGGSPTGDGLAWLTDDEWAMLEPLDDPEALSIRYAYTPGWCAGPLTPWGRP